MIHGHKPNAYFIKGISMDGHTTEGESRQCIHCLYVWEYKPGSGDRRGWCLKHNGFLCARPECQAEQDQWIAQYFAATGKVVSCLAHDEWNDFLAHRLIKTPDELRDKGVIL